MVTSLHDTPLRERHEAYVRQAGPGVGAGDQTPLHRPGAATGRKLAGVVDYIPYGPRPREAGGCEVVATFGEVEAEYAAIRKGAGLLDSPHRGTLLITGDDRRDFLNRLLTAELKDLEAGCVKRSFWLNRKGRIEADLVLIELGDRLLVDLDIHQAASTERTLSEFLFTDIGCQSHRDVVFRQKNRRNLNWMIPMESSVGLNDGLKMNCAPGVIHRSGVSRIFQ